MANHAHDRTSRVDRSEAIAPKPKRLGSLLDTMTPPTGLVAAATCARSNLTLSAHAAPRPSRDSFTARV